ncbi:ABC transporter ATP-binding protein, partial [sediment metagenome]
MIELNGISHRYNGSTALAEITFTLAAGEKAVLLGTNGSGKSTLLKVLNGLVAPSAGEFRYGGEAISPGRLKERALNRSFRGEVALLFQNPDAMLFNPTVFDEIAF